MKLFIFTISILILFPSISWGEYIRIDSKLYFAGKKIGSPRVLSTIGEKSKMFVKDANTSRDYSLEVTALRISKKFLRLNYSLSIREKNNEILSRGTIKIANDSSGRVLLDGRRAEIRFKLQAVGSSRSYVKN